MSKHIGSTIGLSLTVVLVGCLAGFAGKAAEPDEQERVVKATQVPPPALAALKKLAAGVKITEFSEEIEHGKTYYEGSWKTAGGKIDALVTPTGDLVEIEQGVAAGSVPKAVLKAAQQAAGGQAQLHFEKTTGITYEVHFKKDNRWHELVLSPDGRKQGHEEGDDDDHDDHGDDDD